MPAGDVSPHRDAPTAAVAPAVTVIVVNWNGRHLLEPCLESLTAQRYPSERLQLLVVDNASTDGSAGFVRERFPSAEVVTAPTNVGFAAGNNLGIAASRGDYVALLNNDAVAEPDWLARLVEQAESDIRIGAVTSKVWLKDDRLEVVVTGEEMAVSAGARVGSAPVTVEYVAGAHSPSPGPPGQFRRVRPDGVVRVPLVEPGSETVTLVCWAEERPRRLALTVGGSVVADRELPPGVVTDVEIPLDGVAHAAGPVVQNAGSVILPDGTGRDRGMVLNGDHVYYATDRGQYDNAEDVPAFCGAACLLRRRALDEVGAFDDSFFMYYEDSDLSLRLRDAGWRIVYEPSARVRHVHAASSVEWSPDFVFYVERNRLLTLLKNAALRDALREWLRYTLRPLRQLRAQGASRRSLRHYAQVQRSIIKRLPRVVSHRRARVVGTPRGVY